MWAARSLSATFAWLRAAPLFFLLRSAYSGGGWKTEDKVRTTIACACASFRTHDGIPLQCRGTSVEHEDRLDSVEEEFGDPTEEAQNVRVDQGPALLVTHGGLELVDPDARVDGKRFALHGFQSFQALSISDGERGKPHNTGRPSGVNRSHRDLTPIPN